MRRTFVQTWVMIALAMGGLAHPAMALVTSKNPDGNNHAAAHQGPHQSTGAGIKVGIIESVDGVDLSKTSVDNDGRLIKHLDFTGAGFVVNVDPGAPGVPGDTHGTQVMDIIASSNATFLGVAPGSNVYYGAVAGGANSDKTMIAAIDYYTRVYGVGQFNMSLFSAQAGADNSQAHDTTQKILNAAGSTANITASPFDFTGHTLTSIDQIRFTVQLTDGDTAAGNFDAGNITLRLDGVNVPITLNGFRNGQTDAFIFTSKITQATSAALMTALADNQLNAVMVRTADLNDTDSGDNSGNRITPSNLDGINARLELTQLGGNGTSKLTMALDAHQNQKDTFIIKSAGNLGNSSATITKPGDNYNGITVGAVTIDFKQRVAFSSYRMESDTVGGVDGRGKPEIVAPGETIYTEFVSGSGGAGDGTSFAAPHVSGIVALLQKGTEQTAGLTLGTAGNHNHLAVKAILMNSARKRFIVTPENSQQQLYDNAATGGEASDGDYLNADGTLRTGSNGLGAPRTREWTPSFWSTSGGIFTTTRPLDDELGAGIADAERALIQLDGGSQGPGAVKPIGWNLNTLAASQSKDYTLDFLVAAGDFITATLTWDRIINRVDDGDGEFDFNDTFSFGSMADFELEILYLGEVIAQSISAVDNFEHLHIPVAIAGEVNDYTIRVRSAIGSGDYALAWWVGSVPEPTTLAVMLLGGIALLRRRA